MFGSQRVNSENAPISVGRVAYTTLGIATPMALSYTFSLMVAMIAIVAGHLPGNSKQNLAAGNLIMQMLTIWGSIAMATNFAIPTYVAEKYGRLTEKKKQLEARQENAVALRAIAELKDDIARVFKPAMQLALLGTISAIIAMAASGAFLEYVGRQTPDLSEQTQGYLRPYAFGLPALALLRLPAELILFSFEKPWLVAGLTLLSFGIGGALAGLMCFGHGVIPAMGFPGLACGFIIESYLTVALLGLALRYDKTFENFNFLKRFFTACDKRDSDIRKELGTLAWPILATQTCQIAAPVVLSFLAGLLGTEALAAQSFSAFLSLFLLIPELALGQAINQEMNRARGQALERYKSIPSDEVYTDTSRVARLGLVTAAATIALPCIAVIAYPKLVTDMMSQVVNVDDPSVIPMAQTTLRITAAGIILDALCNTMIQPLRSLNANGIATLLSIAPIWAGVGIGAGLAFGANWGIYGLATGFVAGNLLGAMLLAWPFIARTEISALAALGNAPAAPTTEVGAGRSESRVSILLPLELESSSAALVMQSNSRAPAASPAASPTAVDPLLPRGEELQGRDRVPSLAMIIIANQPADQGRLVRPGVERGTDPL